MHPAKTKEATAVTVSGIVTETRASQPLRISSARDVTLGKVNVLRALHPLNDWPPSSVIF